MGFTTGVVREGVWEFEGDEGAPTEAAVGMVERLVGILGEGWREVVWGGEVESDGIRLWSNPELYVNPGKQTLLTVKYIYEVRNSN